MLFLLCLVIGAEKFTEPPSNDANTFVLNVDMARADGPDRGCARELQEAQRKKVELKDNVYWDAKCF